ncbi:TraI [Legionella rubrilucens]|uniref:TraI n=1 Tax=Legionella rubrilucens TaxID=458 RepID=A0A0W0XLT8_9GAMM|nr:toprim domain-containing protein [Legionella rubrilucens]KTD45645.1 TraI [Legionella rubrilucens]
MRIKSITELQAFIIDEKKLALAKQLWESSQPITNTPAEKYLVDTRRIPAAVARSLSFKHLRGPLGIKELDENKPYRDYVVTPVHDLDNRLIGVQLIQVGADGQKAQGKSRQFYCKKYIGATTLSRPGKAAIVNPGVSRDVVYVAEGVETAASVAVIDAIKDNYAILASLGVDALPIVLGYVKTHYPPGATVVLLKDHDKKNSLADQAFGKAKTLFIEAGYTVVVKEPPLEETDWNDELQSEGPARIHEQFDDLVSGIRPEWVKEELDEESTLQQRWSDRLSPAVFRYFSCIYNELLVLEHFSEKKALFLKVSYALSELEKRVLKLGELLTMQEDFGAIVREIKEIKADIKILNNAWAHLTGQSLENPAESLQPFKTALRQYEKINEKRKKLLNEDLENFSLKSNDDEAAVYRAYYTTLELLQAHITSLSEQDKERFKYRKFLNERLGKIGKEIQVLKGYQQELEGEAVTENLLREQMQSLQTEKNFLRQELAVLDDQLNLLAYHTGFSGEYAHYSRHFVDFVNHRLLQCEYNYSAIRKLVTREKEGIRSHLQKEYGKLLDKAMAYCRKHLAGEMALLQRANQGLKNEMALQIEQLEKELPSPAMRFQHYHQAFLELDPLSSDARGLQEWVNSLTHFKMVGPLVYTYPDMDTEAGVALVDTFLDYDSDEEETISTLTSAVLTAAGGEYDESSEGNSQFEVLQKEAIARLCGIDKNEITEGLLHTIMDFTQKLSLSLYKSFTVMDPETKARQEFDGIALRGHCLTIIERKSNDGTGDGLLQRNFCQNKIIAKMQFLQKRIICKIMDHPTPEAWLLLDTPELESWYSRQFTPECQERLVLAAKTRIIEAFKAITLEFTLNRGQSFARENYNGLFFNREHGLCDVHIRFSRQQKGNEKIAHARIEKLSSIRSSSRSG